MAIKELFQDARPKVLFDPKASQRIDPRFKFTRNGPASYYDRDRVLRFAAANEPRFDHNPTTGESLGLLVEESRTNLTTYSASTYNGSTNIIPNALLAPDATFTAAAFQPPLDTNGAGTHELYRVIPNIGAIATGNTVTVYAKMKTGSALKYLVLRLHTNSWFNHYNLETGQVTVNDPQMPGSMTNVGNGWWRCQLTNNTSAGTTSGLRTFVSTVASIANQTNGDPIYLWGVQNEVGSFPTSYIPTTSAAVTRAPDLISIEGTNLPSTGSIYIDARALSSDVNDTLLSAANASDDKLTLAIRQPASLYNSKALVYEVDGVFKPTLPFPVPSVVRERNLITYGANNYHYRQDSARLTPSSSASVPAAMNRLGIGHDVTDPTRGFTGYINTVYLWPGEITPTVAEALVRGDVDPKDADAGAFTPEAGALAFVFNTQGTATDGNRVVQLPVSGSTNNILVDWGDNTSSSFIGAAASSTVSHTYPSAGIYPVQITADDDGTNSGLENLNFFNSSQRLDLVRVLQWGGSTTWNPTTMYRAFRDCTQLNFETAARTNLPNTSAITNWQEAFYNCSSISGTFPTFNTTAATTFNGTWFGCSSLTAFPFITSDSVTNFAAAWQNCTSLTSFPLINTAAGTNFGSAWSSCNSLTSFPLINTAAGTSFFNAWIGCNSLTSFPLINTAAGTNFQSAWSSCNSLTSFPLIDTAAGTNFGSAWSSCNSLTSFPLINTAAGTNFVNAWQNCTSLTSFPLINTAAGTNFSSAWRDCNSLTSFPLINTAAGTNFQSAWRGCTSLTSFPLINTAAGTSFGSAWQSCSSLTSFPLINTAAGTNFSFAWLGCSSLTSFPALDFDTAVGLSTVADVGFQSTWFSCTQLADFPPNLFDNTIATRFLNAFQNCALTAASIENIIVSINAAGTSNGNLSLQGGTNAGASTWTTAAVTAYNALVARGWTITRNA